jgi:glycosyltransferase involved in cell wall biosynthesis
MIAAGRKAAARRPRPVIAYFNSADVFEDFYPSYGVDQRQLLTGPAREGGNSRFISMLQREFGDVTYYHFSLAPEFREARHDLFGHRVKVLPAPGVYKWLRAAVRGRDWGRWQRAQARLDAMLSYAVQCSWPLISALLRDRPDVLFLQDYSSGRFDVLLILARLLGVPLIARHSGSTPEGYRGRILKRWTIPRAGAFIVSSCEERDMLAGRYRVPRERLWVVLTPIDTAVFQPLDRTAACRAAGLDPARRYLLFAGRLDDEQKRVGALLRTFAMLAGQHDGIDLLIAGDGLDAGKLRREALELAPGRVRFLGWISETDALVRLYNIAECLLLPSRNEGFPAVIGEAMACGTPVAGARVGGVGELVVPEQTGWLFPPNDDDAFALALRFVMAHPEVLAAMRPRARALAEARVSPGVVAAALGRCLFSVGIGAPSCRQAVAT